jgi:hypothetical protein
MLVIFSVTGQQLHCQKRLISVHLNNNNNIAIKSNSSFIYVLTQRVKGQLQNMHSQRDKQNKRKQDNK